MYVILSIFDKKAEEYGPLFLARTDAVGARIFADAVTKGENSNLRLHPEDFALMAVGQFDEETGALWQENTHQHVVVIEAEAVVRLAFGNGVPEAGVYAEL